MKRHRWTRALLLILLLLVVGLVVLRVGFALLSKGTQLCEICATCREQTSFAGIPIWSGPPQESEESLAIYAEYHAWHEQAVPGSHRHSWRHVGCWGDGSRVVCSGSWASAPYAALPRLADQEWARAFAARITETEPGERKRILRGLESVACGHDEHIATAGLPDEMVDALREAFTGRYAERLPDSDGETGL